MRIACASRHTDDEETSFLLFRGRGLGFPPYGIYLSLGLCSYMVSGWKGSGVGRRCGGSSSWSQSVLSELLSLFIFPLLFLSSAFFCLSASQRFLSASLSLF